MQTAFLQHGIAPSCGSGRHVPCRSWLGPCGVLRHAALLALLALLAGGCSSRLDDLPPAPATTDIASYRLGPTDRISVIVFGEPELSSEITLDSLGRLALPFVGEIDARGLTVPEVKARITEKLKSQEILNDPQVSIGVIAYRPYFVLGEVRSPGAYPYAAGTTVIRAVAQAGGYTYRADRSAITVTREGEGVEYRAGPGSPILPGDMIEVQERFF